MFDEMPEGEWGGAHWCLVDPRPMLLAHPYTFFVPSRREIAAIEPGEIVKLGFKDMLSRNKPSERMWVTYEGRDGDGWYGCLDTTPNGLEGLKAGAQIRFQPWHILSVWNCKVDDPASEDRYFARASVDKRILDGDAHVHRLERRRRLKLSLKRSRYKDSGWRFMAADTQGEARNMVEVAIGLVLNIDDGMLDLLDAPYGARIERKGTAYRLV